MSRIGKKPIPLPSGVKYTVQGNTVVVEGPKGKVEQVIPAGIKLETKDGQVHAVRESDSQAAVHGLTRALVSNAIEGVTKGWSKDLDIVGIGYRAELKGKNTVVFTLGYLAPDRVSAAHRHHGSDRPEADAGYRVRHRPPEGWSGRRGHALAAQARSVQEQGRALLGREAEEEGRQDRSEVIAS